MRMLQFRKHYLNIPISVSETLVLNYQEKEVLGKGRETFVIRTLKYIKVRCHTCDYINLIPTYGKFDVPEHVHCEVCGKVVLERRREHWNAHFTHL